MLLQENQTVSANGLFVIGNQTLFAVSVTVDKCEMRFNTDHNYIYFYSISYVDPAGNIFFCIVGNPIENGRNQKLISESNSYPP